VLIVFVQFTVIEYTSYSYFERSVLTKPIVLVIIIKNTYGRDNLLVTASQYLHTRPLAPVIKTVFVSIALCILLRQSFFQMALMFS
jgi:hypothetical protein